ncbi:MAG: electron transfer flavoprotein subunit alpha/FixB family protein, partial [Saprospiraceae bacterium]|nr:electron transfer flavoprotein subunit alpha/FixB family protein [Saprospiraceae bacterium]
MSVLVYAESPNGVFKKAAFEVVTFAKKVATSLGVPCYAITIGESSNATELGSYGAEKVFTVNDVKTLDSQVYTSILAQAAKQLGAKILILPNSSNGKSIIGRLAV